MPRLTIFAFPAGALRVSGVARFHPSEGLPVPIVTYTLLRLLRGVNRIRGSSGDPSLASPIVHAVSDILVLARA